MNLKHKLHMLGSATWTHTQLDAIGRETNQRIANLELALESIIVEAEFLARECSSKPHACPACEILCVAKFALRSLT